MNFGNKHKRDAAAMTVRFVVTHFFVQIVAKINGKFSILV